MCRREMHEGEGPRDLLNCGGDCVRCMAEAGDPDCQETMRSLNAVELLDVLYKNRWSANKAGLQHQVNLGVLGEEVRLLLKAEGRTV